MTQAQFAERVGTTQSVIARLESGRHAVRIDLLKRIADAFNDTWAPVFGDPSENQEVEQPSTGDRLLDAFNAANVASDFDTAHLIAAQMTTKSATPRRSLAVALDAFNHADYDRALEWCDRALSHASELPPTSCDTAKLVRGRVLLAMGRADEAVEQLEDLQSESLGWLVDAARAEAFSEAGSHDEAVKAARCALESPGRTPETLYVAARVEWHANRPWAALGHVAAFRGLKPNDAQGAMLQGAILGFLGDQTSDLQSYEAALDCFAMALPTGGCHAKLLAGRAMARLGRTRDALDQARSILALDDCAEHGEMAIRVVEDALRGFEGPGAELEALVNEAELLSTADAGLIASQRCLARALQGDPAGAAAAVGLTVQTMVQASLGDQIRIRRCVRDHGGFAERVSVSPSSRSRAVMPGWNARPCRVRVDPGRRGDRSTGAGSHSGRGRAGKRYCRRGAQARSSRRAGGRQEGDLRGSPLW